MDAKKAPNSIDKHVGSRVRMRRMMLAMSQVKLGEALGLTFQQVQKYETGTNRIGASRLEQISHILQVPVEFFFEGVDTSMSMSDVRSLTNVNDFISSSEGLRRGPMPPAGNLRRKASRTMRCSSPSTISCLPCIRAQG